MIKEEIYRGQEVRYKGAVYKVTLFNWAESDMVELEALATGDGPYRVWASDLTPNYTLIKGGVDTELFNDIYKILIEANEKTSTGYKGVYEVSQRAKGYFEAGGKALEQLQGKYD